MTLPKAFITCVDFDDLLVASLKANAKHFDQVIVITAPHDKPTIRVASTAMNTVSFATDAFYQGGASFNKGLAIEKALNLFGRSGWIVCMDVDIVLPDPLPIDTSKLDTESLYGARRRMCYDPAEYKGPDWSKFHVKFDGEIPGCFQLFHGSAAALKDKPWYGTSWRHAGGYDSDFEAKFRPHNTQWLPFDILHLGEDGNNWYGRVSERLDGKPVRDQEKHADDMHEMQRLRHRNGNMDHEKL